MFTFYKQSRKRIGVMGLNITFNNMLALSWWQLLLVEESGVPGEKH